MDQKPSVNAGGPVLAGEHEIPTERWPHEYQGQATAKHQPGTEKLNSGPTFTYGSSIQQPAESARKITNRLMQCHICMKTVLCNSFRQCTVFGEEFWLCENCWAQGGDYEILFPKNHDGPLPVIRPNAPPTWRPVSDSGHTVPDNAALADNGVDVSSSGERNDSGHHGNNCLRINMFLREESAVTQQRQFAAFYGSGSLSRFGLLDASIVADDAETCLQALHVNTEETKDTEAHPGGKALTEDKYQRRLAAIQRTDSAIDMAYDFQNMRPPATLEGLGGLSPGAEDKANDFANLGVSTAVPLRPDAAHVDTEPSGHQPLPEESTSAGKGIFRKSLRLMKKKPIDFGKLHRPDSGDRPAMTLVETIKKKFNVRHYFAHRPKDDGQGLRSLVGKPPGFWRRSVFIRSRCPSREGKERPTAAVQLRMQ